MSKITASMKKSILNSSMKDPHSILGMHPVKEGVAVRAFRPGAVSVSISKRGERKILQSMEKVSEEGIFAAVLKNRKKVFDYDLVIEYDTGQKVRTPDSYSFLPTIDEDTRYLYNQGNHHYIYKHLGSHLRTVNRVKGVSFAVWAPNAERVSVVGDFNNWDGRVHPMRLLGTSGIWELFVPGLSEGDVYKYEIKKHEGGYLVLKSDPFSASQQPFPWHGSRIVSLDKFKWTDKEYMDSIPEDRRREKPLSIYELHLGSWRKAGPGEKDWLSYMDIAEELADYIEEMGYTHVELLPVQEHPYEPSWGYQVGGFYAVNYRFGSPEEFQGFVNYMHKRGIGVILDWVSGHFPKDEYGLAKFEGTCLYEHEDPREGEQKDWGTLIFNYGRHEVRNFLISNAIYWVENFHVDGLRVDAVASMLYKDYSREGGDWIPNKYGGRENLEAIEFLQSVNHLLHDKFPWVMTIAEESTSWPMVSYPTSVGGLGFTYKWNMGWMHDILEYFSNDPVFRKYHQDKITFGLFYAFTENFILVLSHDEVVHGKKSLLEKMPGNIWEKFANLRALFGFMFAHPGKKMMFMGGEFGMHNEWFEKRSIDWHVIHEHSDSYHHGGLMRMIQDLNRIYRSFSAFWERDYSEEGFEWIDHSDHENSVVTFLRQGKRWDDTIIAVCNFTPVVRYGYRVGVPFGGKYKEVFNSDAIEYGGAGYGNLGGKTAELTAWNNRPCSVELTLPPLSVCMFRWEKA